MPKEPRNSATSRAGAVIAPYPQQTPQQSSSTASQRVAAIWSTADDDILLQARATGLNWQPIASRHFPNKTANACRKRHERLVERRHDEEWDSHKLELLAEEYLAIRRDMWEMLSSRIGERWAVVEAKVLEKGLKNLQSVTRTAQRKASATDQGQPINPTHLRPTIGTATTLEEQSIPDHHSDSGIGLGSDTEMEASSTSSTIHDTTRACQVTLILRQHLHHPETQTLRRDDHARSRSLPQPLPLFRPPPPISRRLPSPVAEDQRPSTSGRFSHGKSDDRHGGFEPYPQRQGERCSPGSQARVQMQSRAGFSIQSVLATPVEGVGRGGA
ncbi:hypothetical protein MBLNU230_g2645t1 [Neophaeotheca triangularis]